MSEFDFTSLLGEEHRDELERLLFFNGNQARAATGVTFVARRYGLPRITVESGWLRVGLGSEVQTQTLYVMRRAITGNVLVGVAIYTREGDGLVVLYVAVHEDYSIGGAMANRMLLVRIKDQIAAIGRRIRGIDTLLLYTGRDTPIQIRLA